MSLEDIAKLREYSAETPQERDDRLERDRKERLKDDEFTGFTPKPLTDPHYEFTGWLGNRAIVLPDGTVEGFRIPLNHITAQPLYTYPYDEVLALTLTPRHHG